MRREFIHAAPAESLLEAHRTMQLARLRHLLVAEGSRLVGLVSYRELQDDALARADRLAPGRLREELRAAALREAIAPSPWFVHPEAPADEAARRMLRLRLGCLPVCADGPGGPRLVGLLSESDLLRAAWTRS
jgi:CBS domain-containing protein